MNQKEKAEFFRSEHHRGKMLLLPNVWDALTARLISSAGFTCLATASFSVAAVNGYEDGEQIPFAKLIEKVVRITEAVDAPVSVDFEKGFASQTETLAENVRRLLDAGAIGINIEDSSGKDLIPISGQCKKIETVRETGIKYGVDLFINARTDAILLKKDERYLRDAIVRGQAYKAAGADGFYPVLIDNYADIKQVVAEVSLPLNVLLMKPVGDLKQLEQIGVRRVSLGPGTLKYVLTKLRSMVMNLHHHDTNEFFSEELISSNDVMALVRKSDTL